MLSALDIENEKRKKKENLYHTNKVISVIIQTYSYHSMYSKIIQINIMLGLSHAINVLLLLLDNNDSYFHSMYSQVKL